MKFTASVNVAPVVSYYNQLAVALNQSLEKTIRMEAAATVRRASQLDPVKPLPRQELTLRAREQIIKRFGSGDYVGTVNKFTGNRSKKRGSGYGWLVNRSIARVMPMGKVWDGGRLNTPSDNNGDGWRTNDVQWSKWKQQFAEAAQRERAAIAARVGARGLTQKSWFELMIKIASGEPVVAPDSIMRARPVKGGSRTVAAAVPTKTPSSFSLAVVNDSGIAVSTGGQRKLNAAIQIRQAFFLRSLERGFYSDAKFIARNYKWAVVK